MATNRFIMTLTAGLTFLLLGIDGIRYLLIYNILLLLLYSGDYLAGRLGGRFELERSAPPRLYQNQWAKVELILKSKAVWRLKLQIRDGVPAPFRRKMVRLGLTVPPKGETVEAYQVRADERGRFAFGSIFWRAEGPLGLAMYQGRIEAPWTVGVYPELDAIHRLDMALRSRRWTEMGFRRTRMKGGGSDLRELREYIPGDDIRKVDWKATARRAHPIVREYEPERGQNLFILLDAGRLMENRIGDRSRLDHAVSAALALAYAGVHHGDRIGLMAFADDVILQIPAAKGRHHLHRVIEALQGIEAEGVESNYDKAFQHLMTGRQKQGIVCLFTELVDEMSSERLLQRMGFLARHHRPICVTFQDSVLKEFMDREVTSVGELYQQGVSLQVIRERERARLALAGRGVAVVDAAPEDLSLQLIAKYLDIKDGLI